MSPRLVARRSCAPAALVAGFLVALAAGTLPAAAAPGEPGDETIESKQAEAAALEREIEELGHRASVVLEEYHQATDALDAADADLLDLRARVEELRREVEATQDVADARILDLYRGTSSPAVALHYLDASSVQEMGVVHHYTTTLADQDRARLDELSVRRTELDVEEQRLEEVRSEVAAQERALRSQRGEVEEAMAQRQAALDRAEGELAELVEAERQRRQEAEARRAREALERRQAEEARRRAEEEARRQAQAEPQADASPGDSSADESDDSGGGAPDEESAPAPSTGPAPPVHPNAGTAVAEARAQLGKPYQWAGNGPESFDCSGLTKWAWSAAGVSIPRSSQTQYAGLPHVAFDAIQPGDLLFYGAPIHHVGIYVGNGEMVNAPYTGANVRIDSIYRGDFAGAARPG